MLGPCWKLVGTILDVIKIKYIFVGTICVVVISTTGTIGTLMFGAGILLEPSWYCWDYFRCHWG